MDKVKSIIQKIEKGISVSEIAREEKINRHSVSLVKQCYEYVNEKVKEYSKKENTELQGKIKEKEEKILELEKAIEKLKADCKKAIENERKKANNLQEEIKKISTEAKLNIIYGIFTGIIIAFIIIAIIKYLKGG